MNDISEADVVTVYVSKLDLMDFLEYKAEARSKEVAINTFPQRYDDISCLLIYNKNDFNHKEDPF